MFSHAQRVLIERVSVGLKQLRTEHHGGIIEAQMLLLTVNVKSEYGLQYLSLRTHDEMLLLAKHDI